MPELRQERQIGAIVDTTAPHGSRHRVWRSKGRSIRFGAGHGVVRNVPSESASPSAYASDSCVGEGEG